MKDLEDNELSILEEKLGISANSFLEVSKSNKRRQALYKSIEEEGIGEDFMGLLDGIISSVKNKRQKIQTKEKIKQTERTTKQDLVFNNTFDNQEINADEISKWYCKYKLKLQGFLNRLSEGNMTIITKGIFETIQNFVKSGIEISINCEHLLNKLRIECIIKALNVWEDEEKLKVQKEIDSRLPIIFDIYQWTLVEMFMQNCITQSQSTLSLITVYTCVFGALGGLFRSKHLIEKLMYSINLIYNKTLQQLINYFLTIRDSNEDNEELYHIRFILRHCILVLMTGYRCGYISSSSLLSFIEEGALYKKYKNEWIYWECLLDNIIILMRGVCSNLKDEQPEVFINISNNIQNLISNIRDPEVKKDDKDFLISKKVLEFCTTPQKLKFVLDELEEQCKASLSMRRRSGMIEDQLTIVQNWCSMCPLLKPLRTFNNKDINKIPSNIGFLVEYNWLNNLDINLIIMNTGISDQINRFHETFGIEFDITKVESSYIKERSKAIKDISESFDKVPTDKLINLANKMRLSSDIQRSVFIAIMGAHDVLDAIQRLTSLNLAQSKTYIRTSVNVIFLLSLSEKTYNPFYVEIIKNLVNLPNNLSKKFLKEINQCLIQQIGLINSFKIRKVLILSQILKGCIFEGIVNMKIIRFIPLTDVHSLAGSCGLFLRELILHLLLKQVEDNDDMLVTDLIQPIMEMSDIKEAVLFVLQNLILPALRSFPWNSTKITLADVLKLCKKLGVQP
ncbi:hypothetical protein cand_030710 [Cryptosporidium andersoni]|uniref:MI domain-containing protein n=1 Tax=Cryptosporidium andersoni TaxID=117008 RepID=A0A1J4MN29_9CRYT|nr:hypothetical protein cand_030710 [Cryptosporidium andersoni]